MINLILSHQGRRCLPHATNLAAAFRHRGLPRAQVGGHSSRAGEFRQPRLILSEIVTVPAAEDRFMRQGMFTLPFKNG